MMRGPLESASLQESVVAGLTKQLCGIHTPLRDEQQVTRVLEEFLDHPRIQVFCEEVVPGRSNLIATVRGHGDAPPLVLSGHSDAGVFEEGWSKDPFEPWIVGRRMYGAGIDDMKGGLAAMVCATRAIADAGGAPGDVLLHAVMHHDTVGLGQKYILASEGPNEGFAVCGEPSNLAIHTANSGAIRFEVVLAGAPAHISRMERGRDALRAATTVYEALIDAELSYEPNDRLPDMPRMHIGVLEAGEGAALVADRARILGDIRTVPSMTRYRAHAELEQIVQNACPEDVKATVKITAVQNPFIGPTSGRLIDALSASHTETFGANPRVTTELPGQAFVTDAADLSRAGLETVVYGVGDWHYGPDQSVDLDELVGVARVYARLPFLLQGTK
jgi:acetylornithine deacetylase